MINTDEYAQKVEREICSIRVVSKATCEAFADLPLGDRIAYARAMAFVGCEFGAVPYEHTTASAEAARIRASRLMLLSLYLDTGQPAWSSWMLDRMLEAVVKTPGGNVGDLFHALYGLLGDYSCALSVTVANFLKIVAVGCFTQHRTSYDSTNLGWMVEKVIEGPTLAQAYLALYAIPPGIMQPKCAVSILRSLSGSHYWRDAINTLDEDMESNEARALLAEWLTEGVPPSCAEDIERIRA